MTFHLHREPLVRFMAIFFFSVSLLLSAAFLAEAVESSGVIYGHHYKISAHNMTVRSVDLTYAFDISCGGLAGKIVTATGAVSLPVTLTAVERDFRLNDKLRTADGRKATRSVTVRCTAQEAQSGTTHKVEGSFAGLDLQRSRGLLEGKHVELAIRLQIKIPVLRDVDKLTKTVRVRLQSRKSKPFYWLSNVGNRWEYRVTTSEEGNPSTTKTEVHEVKKVSKRKGFKAVAVLVSTTGAPANWIFWAIVDKKLKFLIDPKTRQSSYIGKPGAVYLVHPVATMTKKQIAPELEQADEMSGMRVEINIKTIKVPAGSFRATCFTIGQFQHEEMRCYNDDIGLVSSSEVMDRTAIEKKLVSYSGKFR